jgi:hypothetical protein
LGFPDGGGGVVEVTLCDDAPQPPIIMATRVMHAHNFNLMAQGPSFVSSSAGKSVVQELLFEKMGSRCSGVAFLRPCRDE